MDKLNVNATGLALSITSGIVYIICAIISWISPRTLIGFANYLEHSIDLTSVAIKSLNLGNVIIGLIIILIISYLVGVIFALLYNKLIKVMGGN
nr:hypothetical protein [Candidatus Woesearchaeota archaeon]